MKIILIFIITPILFVLPSFAADQRPEQRRTLEEGFKVFDKEISASKKIQETTETAVTIKDAIPNCSEIGTLNTIVGIIGLMQANEVLKLVCGIGNPLVDELLIYNSLENSQYKMKLKKSFDKDRIQHIFDSESYFDAVKKLPPSQIETIDMARRGIHNEGSRVLQERLEGKAEIDIDTARRLFTLICVLHFGG